MHPDNEWLEQAKCRTMNPDDFDLGNLLDKGVDGNDVAQVRAERAMSLCEGCPVIAECARDALVPLSVGLVRAGVYVPVTTEGSKRAQVARDQLMEMAA